jgi:hypothetical protein
MKNITIKKMTNAILLMALVLSSKAQINLFKIDNSAQSDYNQLGIQSAKTLIINTAAKLQLKQLSKAEMLDGFTIKLPNASQDDFIVFNALENKIMEDALSEQLPEIKTFYANSIDGKYQAVFEWTYSGFHAMLWYADGIYMIDPKVGGAEGEYSFYNRVNFPSQHRSIMSCGFDETMINKQHAKLNTKPFSKGQITRDLRTYRLALACTGEYATFHGGTVPLVASAFATTMNRVNGVYQKELGVKMILVANNNSLIFLNAATDGFTNSSPSALLNENTTKCNTIIGTANYDIGHVFSTGGGGLANLACVCDANDKARGETGASSPVGDPFDIDYVAHEIGHQFGGNHTFNSSTSSCGGNNRNASTAYEVGSGSTIMAYAGICGSDDIQPNSDAFFHSVSYDEIDGNINFGTANTCGTVTSSSNNIPTAIGTGIYTIPAKTPFVLSGGGADIDGDTLSYEWEQFDLGPSTTKTSPSGNSPAFRCFVPAVNGMRTFPRLSGILAGTNTTNGEVIPAYTRQMSFRLIVRDKKLPVGGFDYTDSTVQVNLIASTTGFAVTAPNTTAVTWAPGTKQLVTWNTSNSDLAPVNCARVRILYSTNGGNAFTLLKDSVINDGSDSVNVPTGINSTTCRIKIESIGNIFFDISNANFKIQPNTSAIKNVVLPTAMTVTISPNPSSNGIYNVVVPNTNGFSYEVYDLLGNTKKSGVWNTTQSVLNIGNLNAGIYYLRIKQGSFNKLIKLAYN